MMSEDIRKLLGGYATNTLTESERKLLFEAALEDQELFDALQQEQALKDLLAHPVTRAEVRQALEKSVPAKAWWSRWWAWGSAVGAAAVAAGVLVVVQENKPTPSPTVAMRALDEQPKISASSAPPPQAASGNASAGGGEKKRESDRLTTLRRYGYATRDTEKGARRAAAQPSSGLRDAAKDTSVPPPPPPVLQSETARQAPAAGAIGGYPGQQAGHTQPQTAQAPVQAPTPMAVAVEPQQFRADSQPAPQLNKQLDTAANAIVANYNGPLVHYSVTKPDAKGTESRASSDADLKTGDVFRLNVSSDVPGYLALYQLDKLGEWKRVYPIAAEPMFVTANSNYTIPDAPLRFETDARKLRLVLAPRSAVRGAIGGALSARSKSKANEGARTDPAEVGVPLVVDINVGANKN